MAFSFSFSFSNSSILSSSRSVCSKLNPLLFSIPRRRCLSLSCPQSIRFRSSIRFATVAGMGDSGVFTSPEVAKAFDFTTEERIYKWWESQGYFKPSFERGNDPFVVSMPPPNVTGSLRMGHAMFVTLEDIMVRYHRMRGRPALWLPGTDHAVGCGKNAGCRRNKKTDLGREEFTR